MTSQVTRADALFQEHVHAQWRDWRTYLAAALVLLDRADESEAAFERTVERDTEREQAERTLTRLPQPQRALFEQLREERRQQLVAAAERAGGRRPDDPDALDRRALTELLREADAESDDDTRPEGWGDVPLLVDGAVQWYRVHVPTLRGAPGASAYAAASGTDDLRRRVVLAAALGVGAVLFLAVWFLWPRGALWPQQAGGSLLVNGTPVPALPVTLAVVIDSAGHERAVPLVAMEAGLSQAALPAAGGLWHAHTVWPLVICVPGDALRDATAVRLVSGADGMERVYALGSVALEQPDVRVRACDGDRELAGVIQRGESLAPYTVGETASEDGLDITVEGIDASGPGEDLTLPADRARVTVRVRAPELDWPAYGPTLTLADGTVVQAPEQRPLAGGVELRYLVPLPAEALEVAWDITEPATGRKLRWRAQVAAPLSREAILARDLVVERVASELLPGEGLVVRLSLTNRSGRPLPLAPTDVALVRGDQATPLLGQDMIAAPLPPGRSEISLSLPDASPPLVLAVGAQRWRIER